MSTMRGPISTLYDEAVCPTPGGEPSGGGLTGGFDLGEGSQKETPNSVSGLPNQLTVTNIGDGSMPGQVGEPPVASPGTSHPPKP